MAEALTQIYQIKVYKSLDKIEKHLGKLVKLMEGKTK